MTQPLVLVTGASGFLGGHVCRYLLGRGYAVRSLDSAPCEHPERDSIDVMLGDIRDPVLVGHAMRGVTGVVHAASAAPTQSADEILSTGVAGTWTVLQTALRNHVARFVYVSCSSVYGTQAHHLMHEGDPLLGRAPRAAAKIEAESLCQAARLTGSCVSILRPTRLIGPEGGSLERLFACARAGRDFRILGRGNQPCQILDVEDLCAAIHSCLIMRADLVNDTFNVGPSAPSTVRASFQSVLDRAGRGNRVLGLAEQPGTAVARLFEHLQRSNWCPWYYDSLCRDNSVSVRHIDRKLDFRPYHSTLAALLRNYDAYNETGGGVLCQDSIYKRPIPASRA
jgi:nucleoside-diphosphate-sugar epimerase